MSENWDSIVVDLRDKAQAMHEAREAALGHCRKLGQYAARSIRHVHRQQFEEAEKLLEQAKGAAEEARAVLRPHPELNPAYLHDTEKEMVEAAAVLAIVRNEPYPTPAELGAQVMSYLNGMGEAASEVRRYALDAMRRGDMELAERILHRMEGIYEELITFDFADSMTGGLRRTCDALRAVIERTRSDLTLTTTQQELVRELRLAREAG
ncbi:haloacid dehalogenase [bacterium]|nr:MAG: haloacid dehalogenase [bacterium]